jgi:hypothetical protein
VRKPAGLELRNLAEHVPETFGRQFCQKQGLDTDKIVGSIFGFRTVSYQRLRPYFSAQM